MTKSTHNTQEQKPSYEELEARIRELEWQAKNSGNREYKSRLFCFLFGREENKAWTLSLYNAINGTSYTDPSAITINTIEDVVYLGMKNDLSILVSDNVSLYRTMNVYEQQSTLNPNMPIRSLMYAGRLYDKYLYISKRNRYGKKLIPLPIPKLVTFYNGIENQDDESVFNLSDAFREEIRCRVLEKNKTLTPGETDAEVDRLYREADPDIQVRVKMVNINFGRNSKLLSACKPLEEYSWFIAQIRENSMPPPDGTHPDIGEAIDSAIREMPDDFLIKKFIIANQAEVKNMCLTEYDEEEVMEMFKEEGREEGREEGIKEGIKEEKERSTVNHLRMIMSAFKINLEKAMDVLDIPGNERNQYKVLINSQ